MWSLGSRRKRKGISRTVVHLCLIGLAVKPFLFNLTGIHIHANRLTRNIISYSNNKVCSVSAFLERNHSDHLLLSSQTQNTYCVSIFFSHCLYRRKREGQPLRVKRVLTENLREISYPHMCSPTDSVSLAKEAWLPLTEAQCQGEPQLLGQGGVD